MSTLKPSTSTLQQCHYATPKQHCCEGLALQKPSLHQPGDNRGTPGEQTVRPNSLRGGLHYNGVNIQKTVPIEGKGKTTHANPTCQATLLQRVHPFMVFSVTYTICKGPKLDAQRSPTVTPANCQADSIHQHK